MSEASTIHVSNISPATTEKEVRDFFSFCGKITSLSVTPTSSEAEATKSATVTFEKEAAAKTALLLDQTQLGSSAVHVEAAKSIGTLAQESTAGATDVESKDEHHIPQEEKPRSRIFAEYLAHGYVVSDKALEKALELDNQHGVSTKFQSYLTNLDQKLGATSRARDLDNNYKISDKAVSSFGGLASYFEKAIGTPSGQKLREFYQKTEKQVLDIHAEARHLANLKQGKSSEAKTGESQGVAASASEAAGVAPGTVPTSEPAGTTAPAEPKA
ncbi:hypothetical protein N7539_005124 [Penicillium diatomitis]|uniref:RRM domain-containing protein n=1 Tax=Penicillium diatomitis TaxID=2819901 RepID=A0A9W9X6T0_9EURO|nr:uncharacterized protein N7539_005124 [Penicillium diatomitis]KAJ5485136.1 hypothetical protein N7539_005124 [Penicillium diatomitis]